jgi:Zn-dependent peptidase ImmA (M78 family)
MANEQLRREKRTRGTFSALSLPGDVRLTVTYIGDLLVTASCDIFTLYHEFQHKILGASGNYMSAISYKHG